MAPIYSLHRFHERAASATSKNRITPLSGINKKSLTKQPSTTPESGCLAKAKSNLNVKATPANNAAIKKQINCIQLRSMTTPFGCYPLVMTNQCLLIKLTKSDTPIFSPFQHPSHYVCKQYNGELSRMSV